MIDTLPLPTVKAQTWLDDREHLESFAKSLDPAAKLAVKKSCLWVGAIKTNATTLGRTVYIPEDWNIGQVARAQLASQVGRVGNRVDKLDVQLKMVAGDQQKILQEIRKTRKAVAP